MQALFPIFLLGCLVSVSAQARWVPEALEFQGPLYTDATLRNFQAMDVKLGMTLTEATKALGQHGFRPAGEIVEHRTNGSAKVGEEVTFVGTGGKVALVYTKLTDSPARVTGVFINWQLQADSMGGRTLEQQRKEIFARYGSPSVWQSLAREGDDPSYSFTWFSQESFRDDVVHNDVRNCHANWQHPFPKKDSTCEETLRKADSAELSITLTGDAILYQLYDYRAAYESLRTNATFMKEARSVGAVSKRH